MEPSHGNVQVIPQQTQVPRAVQADLQRLAAATAVTPLFSRARDRLDRPFLQVQGADQVVPAVGDVQDLASEGHPLRVVEGRPGKVAVVLTGLAEPGNGDLLALQVRNDYTM